MKKAFLSILTVLLFTSLLTAQGDRGTKFGFRVSPGVSWFNPDMSDVSGSPRLSFGFGAMADIPLMSNIALSTGLGGNFVGGTMKFPKHAIPVADPKAVDGNYYLNKGTYKLRYVKVPLTFKGMTNKIGHLRYFLEFGGSMAFNYYARMDYNGTPVNEPDFETEDYPIKRMVRAFRATMLIRAGAEYNMTGSTNLVLSLTFDNGLTNTFNPDKTPTYVADSDNRPLDDNQDGKPDPSDDMSAIVNDIKINVGVLF